MTTALTDLVFFSRMFKEQYRKLSCERYVLALIEENSRLARLEKKRIDYPDWVPIPRKKTR